MKVNVKLKVENHLKKKKKSLSECIYIHILFSFLKPLTLSMSTRAGPVWADTSGAYSPIHNSPLIQTLYWLGTVSKPFLLLLLLPDSFSSSSSSHHSTSNYRFSSHSHSLYSFVHWKRLSRITSDILLLLLLVFICSGLGPLNGV